MWAELGNSNFGLGKRNVGRVRCRPSELSSLTKHDFQRKLLFSNEFSVAVLK